MLSEYELKIADLCNIPIGNVKNQYLTFFDNEKYVLQYEKLQLYLRIGLILKEIHRILEFNQLQQLKSYVEFNTKKEQKQ